MAAAVTRAAGYRRIDAPLRQRVQPTALKNSPPGRWRAQGRISRFNARPNEKDDLAPGPNPPGAALHRTLQEFTDRHWRPRKFAKNPVVFGQEPGRDLSQSREQRPFLLAAIRCHSSAIPDWRLDALPRRLRRRIECDTGWRDRQRLPRARLGFRERALLGLLIAARQGGLRRLRKLRRRDGCRRGRHAFQLVFGFRPRGFAKERVIVLGHPRPLYARRRYLHDRGGSRLRPFDLAEDISAGRARDPRPRDLDKFDSESGQKRLGSHDPLRFQTID